MTKILADSFSLFAVFRLKTRAQISPAAPRAAGHAAAETMAAAAADKGMGGGTRCVTLVYYKELFKVWVPGC